MNKKNLMKNDQFQDNVFRGLIYFDACLISNVLNSIYQGESITE